MNKFMLLIILMVPLFCSAQKDFDYTIYTSKAYYSGIDTAQTDLRLTLYRKIQKDANVIKFISINNTGDAITFNINYVGYDSSTKSLVYTCGEGIIIYCNPMIPSITINDGNKKTKQEYY